MYRAPPHDVIFINPHTLVCIISKSFEALIAPCLGKDVLWCLSSMHFSHTWCNVIFLGNIILQAYERERELVTWARANILQYIFPTSQKYSLVNISNMVKYSLTTTTDFAMLMEYSNIWKFHSWLL